MSPFGKIFRKDKENPETELDLSADEEELPQAFRLEPAAKDPEPSVPEASGEAASEEQPDPLSSDDGASAGAQEEQKQDEKQEEDPKSKEDDVLGLFGMTTHAGSELQALSNDIEDVPIGELLADLQGIAATLRRGSPPAEEGRREDAA